MPTSESDPLLALGLALMETDARERYPQRQIDPEQMEVGELCCEVSAAHQPGLVGVCVSCHEPHPCRPHRETLALGLERVVLAGNALLRKWSADGPGEVTAAAA